MAIGGVTLTCAQAAGALDALASAGGIMIRQVLSAAGSPLAGCDYLAALEPYREPPPDLPGCGPAVYGRGAAGRPAARQAFMRAIRAALEAAERAEPARQFAAELDGAQAAFSADEGYAAAMAKAAVAVLSRQHAAGLRAALSSAVHRAVAECGGSPEAGGHLGGFACAAVSACGTGDCRLASAPLAGPAMTVPAGPGRVPRPGNHVHAGQGTGTGAALAALEMCVPFDVAAAASTVRLASGDCSRARDAVTGGPA